jgi:long-chain acyl-CoA synthetase
LPEPLSYPNISNLKEWCNHHHVKNGVNSAQLIRDPKVIELYKTIVEEFNKNFNHVEQVKKFELLDTEWTIEGGELTPTLKLKRKVIMEKYRDAIDRIYD